jgi:site-specific DNA-methyltransferase (adenine-specific)
MNKILFNGDSKIELQKVQNNSVDFMATDPPYGYSFMGKSWDKVLPDREIWKESFRVLKEGSFICVMAAPRSDVLWRLCRDLEGAGFDLSFTNIEWVYHSGFPKASDVKKMMEKRGVDGDKYEGSKLGFQPKPAREIIIVGMKPFKEKSYIDKVLNFEELPENIQRTYPLIQTPKPSKKEKDMGLSDNIPLKQRAWLSPQSRTTSEDYTKVSPGHERWLTQPKRNSHPTIKPIKLMSYLITLFTREGDWVLDPFMGSGTTGLACKLLNRNFIGIDYEEEYFNIAEERLEVSREELIKTLKIKVQGELF